MRIGFSWLLVIGTGLIGCILLHLLTNFGRKAPTVVEIQTPSECLDSSICSKYALLRSRIENVKKYSIASNDALAPTGKRYIFRDNNGRDMKLLQHHETKHTIHLSGMQDGVKYLGAMKLIDISSDDTAAHQSQSRERNTGDVQRGNRRTFHAQGDTESLRRQPGSTPQNTVKEVRSLTGYAKIGGKDERAVVQLHPVPCPNAVAVSTGGQPSCGPVQYQCSAGVHLQISVYCPPFIPPAHATAWYQGKEYTPPEAGASSSGTLFVPGHGWLPLAGNDDFPACSQVSSGEDRP